MVVDCLTKMVHFIPCTKAIIGERTSKLFFVHVFWYYGLLENIIFDYGLQFASKFWKWLFKLLGVKVKFSSTFHPYTYGQIKWVNQVLEQYLRCTTNYHKNNWSKLLAMAKFDYNNTMHSLTQQTFFCTNHGLHPSLTFKVCTKLWIH